MGANTASRKKVITITREMAERRRAVNLRKKEPGPNDRDNRWLSGRDANIVLVGVLMDITGTVCVDLQSHRKYLQQDLQE